jgi:hypothetical protein
MKYNFCKIGFLYNGNNGNEVEDTNAFEDTPWRLHLRKSSRVEYL